MIAAVFLLGMPLPGSAELQLGIFNILALNVIPLSYDVNKDVKPSAFSSLGAPSSSLALYSWYSTPADPLALFRETDQDVKPSASCAKLELGAPRARVGAVSAIVFLALNGYDFEPLEDDLAEMVYGIARSELEKSDVALFLRQ
jgi:hypothetical protein